MTKVTKIWPFLTGPSKYHDHHLSTVMSEDSIETIFYAPNYTDPLFRASGLHENSLDCFKNFELFNYFLFFGKTIPLNPFKIANKIVKSSDVIHFFGLAQPSALLLTIIMRLIGYKDKIFFNEHTDLSIITKSQINYHKILVLLYSLFCGKIVMVCCDENTKKYWVKIGFKSEIKVIPLGYNDNEFFVTEKTRQWRELRIGFAGRIDARKNIEILLEKSIEFPDVKFYICGFNSSNYSRSLLNRVNAIGSLNIHTQPFVASMEELRAFYNNIDVAIYPGSITIGTFEANACGCFVVFNRWDEDYSNRLEVSRGLSFENSAELSNLISILQVLKTAGHWNPGRIAADSKDFSWQQIKYDYYRLYGLS